MENLGSTQRSRLRRENHSSLRKRTQLSISGSSFPGSSPQERDLPAPLQLLRLMWPCKHQQTSPQPASSSTRNNETEPACVTNDALQSVFLCLTVIYPSNSAGLKTQRKKRVQGTRCVFVTGPQPPRTPLVKDRRGHGVHPCLEGRLEGTGQSTLGLLLC